MTRARRAGYGTGVDERERRIGQNEALFRRVNEQLQGLNEAFATVTDTFTVLCECGDANCTDQITMATHEYEQLRADPSLFAVRPGHDDVTAEGVVERRGAYDVVKKRPGGPTRLAAATDPRAD